MGLPKEIKEKIQQCASIECNRIIEKEKADDGIMPVLLKVQLCDDYEVGAQIATDHFTPIIAEKDKEIEALTNQLKKVKALLKKEVLYHMSDYIADYAIDNNVTYEQAEEAAIDKYCEEHGIEL